MSKDLLRDKVLEYYLSFDVSITSLKYMSGNISPSPVKEMLDLQVQFLTLQKEFFHDHFADWLRLE